MKSKESMNIRIDDKVKTEYKLEGYVVAKLLNDDDAVIVKVIHLDGFENWYKENDVTFVARPKLRYVRKKQA